MGEPEPYDMMCLDEIKRWFREMGGYLKTSDFLNDGTDKEGRKYAMDGFDMLRHILGADPDKRNGTMDSPIKEKEKESGGRHHGR